MVLVALRPSAQTVSCLTSANSRARCLPSSASCLTMTPSSPPQFITRLPWAATPVGYLPGTMQLLPLPVFVVCSPQPLPTQQPHSHSVPENRADKYITGRCTGSWAPYPENQAARSEAGEDPPLPTPHSYQSTLKGWLSKAPLTKEMYC